MNIVKRHYYCMEELIEDLSSKGYSNYKLNALIDQAIDNYSATNKWYVEYANTTPSLQCHVDILRIPICQN